MLNSIKRGKELINQYNSYYKKVYEELEKLSEDTFEVFNDNRIIIIKNENLKKSFDMQGFKDEYRHRSKLIKRTYKELELKKFYFNINNIKLVLDLYKLNENFKIKIYNESVEKGGPDVYIIKENNTFTFNYDNYISYNYKMSEDCIWYVLERILFFLDNN